MVARKRAKGPVQGSSRAFCSAGDSNVPAVAESKSELARVPGATTVKLIEAFDAMKEFEKDRIPRIDLPSVCNDFHTSREPGSCRVVMRLADKVTGELVRVSTDFSAWDELSDPNDPLEMVMNEIRREKDRTEREQATKEAKGKSIEELVEDALEEDSRVQEEDEEDEETKNPPRYTFTVTIAKEGRDDALTYICEAEGENFFVIGVGIHGRGEEPTDESNFFPAMRFGEDVAVEFIGSLADLGINEQFMDHMYSYRLHDEQQEYLQFLDRVTDYLEIGTSAKSKVRASESGESFEAKLDEMALSMGDIPDDVRPQSSR